MSRKYCCDDLMFSSEKGPDDPVYLHEGQWRVSCDRWVARFCPFCGTALPSPVSEEAKP